MKVFFSWSGETSKQVAMALRDWLPNALQAVEPWLSADIKIGQNWFEETQRQLEMSEVSIVCLTRENFDSQLLSFESGGLSKQGIQLVPYLLDLHPREVTGPLRHFQCEQATYTGTLNLVLRLNEQSSNPIPVNLLKETFTLVWPNIEARLSQIHRIISYVQPSYSLSIEEKIDKALDLLHNLVGRSGASDEVEVAFEEEEKPRVFIGSSTEALPIAECIQIGLDSVAECTIWNQSKFSLGKATIESVVDASRAFNFAVLVLSSDDMTTKRGALAPSPRDNILFELGLFTGSLGRARTFMVCNEDEQLHLPSDLAGVTTATFRTRSDGNLLAALGPVCTRIKQAMGVF